MVQLLELTRPAVLVTAFQVAVYVTILLLYTAVVLEIVFRVSSAAAPYLRVVNSVLAATRQRMWTFGAPYLGWLALAVAIGLPISGNGWLLTFPPAGSEARELGDNIATVAVFLWISLGVAGTGGTAILNFGLTKGEDVKLARRLQFVVLLMILLGPMMVALYWPGPFAIVGMMIAVASSLVLHLHAIRLIAFIRRLRSPRATAIEDLAQVAEAYAVQVSDVHFTMPGTRLVQGGEGGNRQLAFLTRRWMERAIAVPKFVLVTGDVIDRGSTEEWEQVLPILRQIKMLGARIIVAPGNHDLATAYDQSVASPSMAQSSQNFRTVDTRRIRDYLAIAAEFEPALACHDGRSLAELLKSEEQHFMSFVDSWRSAAQAAAVGVKDKGGLLSHGIDPDRPDARALAALRVHDAAEAARLLAPVIERAQAIFSHENFDLKKDTFAKAIFSAQDFHLPPVFEQAFRWRQLWYGSFPLRTIDEASDVEFLIVNSNAPEPGLVGSGFGRLGDPQLERLQKMVSASTARNIAVLMHHPVCGWVQEPADRRTGFKGLSMDRWAFLAHETRECERVIELLGANAPDTCSAVFLCCGHRHGHARVGHVVAHGDDSAITYPRLYIMESAALPDLALGAPPTSTHTNTMLALARRADGGLSPGTIPVD